jgi:hydroxymethylpyrimidine/phosphomethylpyrimidine kinase
MRRPRQIRTALTIAGSDSGGGAGIQADLKTLAALGVHGTSVITCITAQNPRSVLGIELCRPQIVRRQLEAVFAELPPAAVKTGMLYSESIVRVVVDFLRRRSQRPLIVDPVMISTSGARLATADALKFITSRLLPLATLVTPNLDEAAALIGRSLHSVEDMRFAAQEIHRRFGCAALVKGGHLRGLSEAVDILYDGRDELLLSAPFIKGIRTHGTGCVYSAAIAGHVAVGSDLATSVSRAKEFVTNAIVQHGIAAEHPVLNCLWANKL